MKDPSSEVVSFLSPADGKLYAQHNQHAFGILVALHEILGHGSGKDLQERSLGVFNFDHTAPPINPLTNRPVETWYKPGQSWKPLFGSSYEECRCERVGLYLSLMSEVWNVLEPHHKETEVAMGEWRSIGKCGSC